MRVRSLAIPIAVALVLVLASTAIGRQPSLSVVTITDGGKPPTKEKRIKGKATANGPFVPGNLESVDLRGMPKRGQVFFVWVGPPQGTDRCEGEGLLCVPEPVELRKFAQRTSGRGRARVKFEMPHQFSAFRLDTKKDRPEKFDYQNGQVIQVQAIALKLKGRSQIVGVATEKTSVAVPALGLSPAPPAG